MGSPHGFKNEIANYASGHDLMMQRRKSGTSQMTKLGVPEL